MRYYLDTNTLVFLSSGNKDDIHHSIYPILSDYANILYTSSVAVGELVLLHKTGKVELVGCHLNTSYRREQAVKTCDFKTAIKY